MNIKEIKEVLSESGIHLRKRWGQNFLTDKRILEDIVLCADILPTDLVIEVGPGLGTLTERLMNSRAKVVAIEIDKKLSEILHIHLKDSKNLLLLQQDILKVDLKALVRTEYCKGLKHIKVVANVPYYITTPIIMHFLESEIPLDVMVLTMQEEVAKRIIADPGTKDYGILSVISQYFSQPRIVRKIKKGAFYPVPKVDSAVVKFDVYKTPPVACDKDLLFMLVKACFSQRRKIIKNTITLLPLKEIDKNDLYCALDICAIDYMRRPETISIHEYAQLTSTIEKIVQQKKKNQE
ncbi:MAG: 16S rRNA (adenine(1518)-N(6)/adenine(1519)-N(6))-dimethyltransferase RsmA [Candidatus Ancaeobacter aquaticus]|nr:16S rRNA (adenine(1518)-N(6)/adenine(1519)-N(6))-dimethyltransferase RsmA [Candidatus Ancaeobacter aquaticus]